jgi:hypothetical protein
LRIGGGFFGFEIIPPNAIHAARRGVNETAHADVLAFPSQFHRTQMIDLVGDVLVELAQRVVGQFGQVHHRLESLKVFFGDIADVFAYPQW